MPCPTLCGTCNKMKTREGLCECSEEFVEALSARIGKHFEVDKLSKEELSNYRRNRDNFIPDSDQLGVSDLIDKQLDLMDVLPPDPGNEVNLEHCSAEQKRIVEDLMENYDAAFAQETQI